MDSLHYKNLCLFFTSLFEGAFFACFLLVILFLGFFCVVFIRVWHMLKKPLNSPILHSYIPKTGDLLLSQWRFAPVTSVIPFVKYFPTHIGIVWNRKQSKNEIQNPLIENKNEIYILEMNHFRKEKNYYKYSQDKKKGLQIINYYDFIDTMEGILYVRQIQNEIKDDEMETLLNKLGHVQFEPRVSNMTWEATFSIGWSFVLPEISKMCSKKLKFHEKEYPDTKIHIPPIFFCSEFVLWFLQCLGYINSDFKVYYTFSPGCYLSFTKKLESITIKNKNTWKSEQIVLKRY